MRNERRFALPWWGSQQARNALELVSVCSFELTMQFRLFNFYLSRALWELLFPQTVATLKTKKHYWKKKKSVCTKKLSSDPLPSFSVMLWPNWKVKAKVLMDKVNLYKKMRCIVFTIRLMVATVSSFLTPQWSGSGVYILFFYFNPKQGLLHLILSNLRNAFNVLLFCILARSDGLQHCCSMPHSHQNYSFLLPVEQSICSKCNGTTLYNSISNYIVQGHV